MKEAIGSIPLYNFIIIFIVITFGFLAETLTYYKAFKVNSRIAYALEEFEGYNSESIEEINRVLDSMGYRIGNDVTCNSRKNMTTVNTKDLNYPVCLYESPITSKVNNGEVKTQYGYFNYGIVTYIYLDIPVLGGTFKVPVYTESERDFRFAS